MDKTTEFLEKKNALSESKQMLAKTIKKFMVARKFAGTGRGSAKGIALLQRLVRGYSSLNEKYWHALEETKAKILETHDAEYLAHCESFTASWEKIYYENPDRLTYEMMCKILKQSNADAIRLADLHLNLLLLHFVAYRWRGTECAWLCDG